MTKKSSTASHYHRRELARRALIYLILALLALFFMLPFYTMLVASFMERSALVSVEPHLWPDPAILDNYVALFFGNLMDTSFIRAIVNSTLLAVGQTIPALLLASLVGFIFAKRDFPGKNILFFAVLVTMMLPYQATIVMPTKQWKY